MTKAKPVELSAETQAAKARRADPKEFPQAVVRYVKVKNEKGEDVEVRETRIVKDPVELKEALKEGWSDPTP